MLPEYTLHVGDLKVGHLGIAPFPNKTVIHSLWVHPDYRGQGLARTLLGQAANDADKEGVVLESNPWGVQDVKNEQADRAAFSGDGPVPVLPREAVEALHRSVGFVPATPGEGFRTWVRQPAGAGLPDLVVRGAEAGPEAPRLGAANPIKPHLPWADLVGLSPTQSAFQRTHPDVREHILTGLLQSGDLPAYNSLIGVHQQQSRVDYLRARQGRPSPYAHPRAPQPWHNPTDETAMIPIRREPRMAAAIPDGTMGETTLKAAGIAVIALDTGRVLMQQRALNPLMCPCGQGVTWDEGNGYQHDDGSVDHDSDEFHGQSVSDLLDQGHPEPEEDDDEEAEDDSLDKTAALEFDPNEGTWEFPGGKIDPGESARRAAIREFREEVGQDLPPGVFVGAWVSPGGIVVNAGEQVDQGQKLGWRRDANYVSDASTQGEKAPGLDRLTSDQTQTNFPGRRSESAAEHGSTPRGAKHAAEGEAPGAGAGAFQFPKPAVYRQLHEVDPRALDDESAMHLYRALEHQPYHPDVQDSYDALERETLDQWRALQDAGLVVDFHDGFGGNRDYPNSKAMVNDVHTGHLWTRHSALDGLSPDHPMARHMGFSVPVQTGDGVVEKPATLNDIFRAVHDVNGHAAGLGHEVVGFGPKGEFNAWIRHRTSYPDEALPALWNETRGQAAHLGPAVVDKGIPLRDAPFLEQKAGLPPQHMAKKVEWFVYEADASDPIMSGADPRAMGGDQGYGINGVCVTPGRGGDPMDQRVGAIRTDDTEQMRRDIRTLRDPDPQDVGHGYNDPRVHVLNGTRYYEKSPQAIVEPELGTYNEVMSSLVGRGLGANVSKAIYSPRGGLRYDEKPSVFVQEEPGLRPIERPSELQAAIDSIHGKRIGLVHALLDMPDHMWATNTELNARDEPHSLDHEGAEGFYRPTGFRTTSDFARHFVTPAYQKDSLSALNNNAPGTLIPNPLTQRDVQRGTEALQNLKPFFDKSQFPLGHQHVMQRWGELAANAAGREGEDILPEELPSFKLLSRRAAEEFFHGTVHAHEPGDVIDPRNSRNYYSDELGEDLPWGTPVKRVFFTQDQGTAASYGEHPGGLFRVEPTGDYFEHPWEKGTLVSAHPLRVVEKLGAMEEPELSADEPHHNDTAGFRAAGWEFTGKDQPTDWDDDEQPYWSYRKVHDEPGLRGLESHAEWMHMGHNEGKPVNQWLMTTFHPDRPEHSMTSAIEQRPGNAAEMADSHALYQANELGYHRPQDSDTPRGTEESLAHEWPSTSDAGRYMGPNQRGSLQGLLEILKHGPSSSTALSGEETDADLFDPKRTLGWGDAGWLNPEDPMRRLNATKKGPVYKGFIYLIQHERDIDLTAREHANPDDPDGDMTEQSAWWDIDHAKKNPALRKECKKGTPWAELEIWADKSVRSNKEIKEAFTRLARVGTDARPKVAMPLTEHVPVVHGELTSGEGSYNQDVSLPSGRYIRKQPLADELDTLPPGPDDYDYGVEKAQQRALAEEFASRFGRGISDPEGEPLAAEATVGNKATDESPTVYVRKYDDFHDMQNVGRGASKDHLDTERGKQMGAFHTVIGDGDKEEFHNMGLLGKLPAPSEPGDTKHMTTVSIDHNQMSLPALAEARAGGDRDETRRMMWWHGVDPNESGPPSNFSSRHFLEEGPGGWLRRKPNNPLGPQDAGRMHGALEAMRPWAREQGIEPWVDAAQTRVRLLGKSAGGAHTIFPYQMAHERTQHVASLQKQAITWIDRRPADCGEGCMVKQMKLLNQHDPVQGWMTDHSSHGGRVRWKVTVNGLAKDQGKARYPGLAEKDVLGAYDRITQGMQHESAQAPAQKAYPLIRDIIAAGRPDLYVRAANEIPAEHHDMIIENKYPEYHQENVTNPWDPKVYAIRHSRNKTHTFLAPVTHMETGRNGWLRGSADADPSTWKLYHDQDLANAITGRGPTGAVPASERYKRNRATGRPSTGEPEPEWQEGDRMLDLEGSQIVPRRVDRWLVPRVSATAEPWWAAPTS